MQFVNSVPRSAEAPAFIERKHTLVTKPGDDNFTDAILIDKLTARILLAIYEMTDKQIILRDYLLKRLGFEESDFKNEYINFLEEIAFIHKGIASIAEKDWDESNPKQFYYYDFENERYLPERFTIIDFLIWEYKLKKERNFQTVENKSDFISATDLANFTYCPVGYSIGKSFEVPKNQLAEIGTKKHEEHRLINSIHKQLDRREDLTDKDTDNEKVDNSKFDIFINSDTKPFFNDIVNSELVFSGHSVKSDKQKYFINKEKGFIGQPDYIFKNDKGKHFVVEEKFKRQKESNQNNFFRNHKVQLASYIYFLNQYQIDYGYLVYWLYEYYNKELKIENCKVLKISRTQGAESFLTTAHNSVVAFNQKKYLNINFNELSAKKCANCVYVLICGHKNLRKNQVSLPYQWSYFNLFRAEYPQELKNTPDEQVVLPR